MDDRFPLAGGLDLCDNPPENATCLKDRQFAEREDERYLVSFEDLRRKDEWHLLLAPARLGPRTYGSYYPLFFLYVPPVESDLGGGVGDFAIEGRLALLAVEGVHYPTKSIPFH